MENKAIFDIKAVSITDLDGNKIPTAGLGKFLGNYIYRNVQLLEWLDIAKAIHAEAAVEVDADSLTRLKALIAGDDCALTMAAKAAVIGYIERLLEANK